jgi:hypothetical protein
MPLIEIIMKCPVEVTGEVLQLKYEAVKDQLRWSTPEGFDADEMVKRYTTVVMSIGGSYLDAMRRKGG